MTEHKFTFLDGEISFSFFINPEQIRKMSKKKREGCISSLRGHLTTCLSHIPKASRTHFCRFSASLLEFATKGVLEDISAKCGVDSGFDI